MIGIDLVQDHLTELKRRDDQQQAALAAQREEADRIYVRLKAEKEASQAAKDEEEFLIGLLQEEEKEAQVAQAVADRKAYEVLFFTSPTLPGERFVGVKVVYRGRRVSG